MAQVDKAILVVDDDASMRMITLMYLERLGFRADSAAHGADALRLMRTTRYKLVFMDLHMPHMDGFETTAAIRALEVEEGRPAVRIVAFTASEIDQREKCLDAGMDDFLLKPGSLPDIEAIVRELKD